jgi:signal transduction histidine kinase
LIANGAKFVQDGIQPVIQIRDERMGDSVRVWFEDNGIGIAPEHRERIFRIFERLHGRESYAGTGIGLAIVDKAIARMNGRVGVESEVGRGSRFWIELPIAETPSSDDDTSVIAAG